jgi:hypothetical protein
MNATRIVGARQSAFWRTFPERVKSKAQTRSTRRAASVEQPVQWGSKQEDSQTLRGARRRRYACRRKATCLWAAVMLSLSHCLFSVPYFYLSLVSLLCSLFLPTSVASHFLSDKFQQKNIPLLDMMTHHVYMIIFST